MRFVRIASLVLLPGIAAAADGVYNVRDFGAKGDGVAKDTAAIQAAIDASNASGGGEVRVPQGRYVTGSLFLKSNVDFHICAGATIEGSKSPEDYNKWDVCPQNNRSVPENHEGGHLFLCIEQTNVVLRGEGTIDGNGIHFMTKGYDKSRVGKRTGRNGLGGFNVQDAIEWRPAQMLWFCESDHVRIEGQGRHVWRPNEKSHLSKSVSPIFADDWRHFICVENGTFKKEDAYVLGPGERHTLSRTIRLASTYDNAKPIDLQPQIDATASAGGGRVTVPPGEWL